MKWTLLELTQRILESMDSDEVNSITDTVESTAVANIIKECFFEIASNVDLPEHYDTFQLTASGDNTKPVLMTLPSNSVSLMWVKYDIQESGATTSNYREIIYKSAKDYLEYSLAFDTGETNVSSFLEGATEVKYYTDRAPRFYTTLDDNTLLFDAHDVTLDTTLQTSKSLAYGLLSSTFTMSDTFTPDLGERQFQLLLNQAKAQAFIELKQTENADAEKKSRRHRISAQRTKNNTPFPTSYYNQLPNFGRKPR